jgi:hypothetical protein
MVLPRSATSRHAGAELRGYRCQVLDERGLKSLDFFMGPESQIPLTFVIQISSLHTLRRLYYRLVSAPIRQAKPDVDGHSRMSLDMGSLYGSTTYQ